MPLHGSTISKCISKPLMLGLAFLLVACSADRPEIDYSGPLDEWRRVGHSDGGQRFSPLTQINRDNVSFLKPAWTYRHGDFSSGADMHGPTAFQATPVVANGSLFFCTPYNRVIALDPESGEEQWTFDPEVNLAGIYMPVCRGVAHWQAERQKPEEEVNTACSERIVTGTVDARLLAIDARTGQRCTDFGDNGEVNLLHGLGDVRLAEYYVTSAPVVVGDLVVTGAFVRNGERLDAPSGAVRAFDIRSGELVWVWDPVPPNMQPVTAEDVRNGKILTRGTPNSWGNLSADIDAGVIYVPVANPEPNHYAGQERGNLDFYGTSVVALDAASGEPLWNFQAVRRDLWDYDIAAQPVIYNHRGDTPAVIAATKMGFIFLLDARTGKPLFPIEERKVPESDVPGEWTASTQPFPSRPPPLHPTNLSRDEVWGITPWDRRHCRAFFDELRYEGIYTPPSVGGEGALAYPGLGGGINWGSVSVDPRNNRMIVNLQVAPFTMKLVPRELVDSAEGTDQVGLNPQEGTPYMIARAYFWSQWQTPCVPPPWGKLVSIDLDSGEIQWERPLGNLNKLAPFGKHFEWGTPNTGGSIQTAGDLSFIAATMDHYFRAFDTETGEELWRFELPYAGHATPMTYRLRQNGKQYVVIAAGGHGALGSEPGDVVMAFALPD